MTRHYNLNVTLVVQWKLRIGSNSLTFFLIDRIREAGSIWKTALVAFIQMPCQLFQSHSPCTIFCDPLTAFPGAESIQLRKDIEGVIRDEYVTAISSVK